jgi:hypothetical protein
MPTDVPRRREHYEPPHVPQPPPSWLHNFPLIRDYPPAPPRVPAEPDRPHTRKEGANCRAEVEPPREASDDGVETPPDKEVTDPNDSTDGGVLDHRATAEPPTLETNNEDAETPHEDIVELAMEFRESRDHERADRITPSIPDDHDASPQLNFHYEGSTHIAPPLEDEAGDRGHLITRAWVDSLPPIVTPDEDEPRERAEGAAGETTLGEPAADVIAEEPYDAEPTYEWSGLVREPPDEVASDAGPKGLHALVAPDDRVRTGSLVSPEPHDATPTTLQDELVEPDKERAQGSDEPEPDLSTNVEPAINAQLVAETGSESELAILDASSPESPDSSDRVVGSSVGEPAVAEGPYETAESLAGSHENSGGDHGLEMPWSGMAEGMELAGEVSIGLADRFRPLDIAELPRELVMDFLLEAGAKLADLFTGVPGTGRLVKVVYDLVSGPRFRGTIARFGVHGFALEAQVVVSDHDWALAPGIGWKGSTEPEIEPLSRSAPPEPDIDRARDSTLWLERFWWLDTRLPCAVVIAPRATIQDLTKSPTVDAPALCSSVRLMAGDVEPPWAAIYLDPGTRLGLMAWNPGHGSPRCPGILQLDRDARTLYTWWVVDRSSR